MKVSSGSAGDGTTTSPAAKKLKQARLPFQIITVDAAKAVAPTKKRKLSEEHEESPNKIGKSTQEDEKISQDKPVSVVTVISDDEDSSKSEGSSSKSELPNKSPPKALNPFISLVDVALKRKLKKRTATQIKKKQKKSNRKSDESAEKSEKSETSKNSEKTVENIEIISIDDDSQSQPAIVKEAKFEEIPSNEVLENKENINKIVCAPESPDDEPNSAETVVPESKSDIENVINTEEASDAMSVDDDDDQKIDDSAVEEADTESSKRDDSSIDSSKEDLEDELAQSSDDKANSSATKEFFTPKSKRKLRDAASAKDSVTPSDRKSPKTPVDLKKLTPKQMQKRLESLKKQQERDKEKLGREKKRQEEKDEKNKQRLEKEEQKKKEREEKEEQKRKEREEKEKLKEQEKKEREEKEEAKRKDKEEKELQKKREKEAKEEERRKKEIEKVGEKRKKELEREELESKKKKASAAFVNFFVPKEKSSAAKKLGDKQVENVVKNEYLSNFSMKSDMRLAPIVRYQLDVQRRGALDGHLKSQETDRNDMYILRLKSHDYTFGRSVKTWPLEEANNDVIIIEDELPIDSKNIILEENHKQNLRPKLLSFSENRRPPYWGTWRRISKNITGRTPFGKDTSILDYECDSDEEWEEEEPGESVGGSVAGSDDEGENDYDVDNEFMVPHGYLSEEEAMGEEDEQILSPEIQKAKLKILQCEFELEMKKSTEKLHPRLLGIMWQKSDGGKPDSCGDTLWNFISNRKILSTEEQIIIQPVQVTNECEPEDVKNNDKPKKSRKIHEEMIPNLIRLIHGNTNSRGFLAHEYQTFVAKSSDEKAESEDGKPTTPVDISKMSIAKKIKEISKWMSCPEEGAMYGKLCWFVTKEIRESHNLDLKLPNTWSYALTPKRKSDVLPKKEVSKSPQQRKINMRLFQ